MTRVIEWLISLLIVVALFVVIALLHPATRTVYHTVETNPPMSTVNDILSSYTRFGDWNALVNHDPRMKIDVSGPESGVGAKLSFYSNDATVGEGSWELVEFEPGRKIVYALDTPGRGKNKTMTFDFERTGQRKQNVKITQTFDVEYGYDLLGRYAGLYITDNVGEDMKLGLGKFSNLMATIPRFDYSQHDAEFAFVDLPAQNVLSATATAKRANDDIAVAMTNQLKWIEQVMEKNKLEPAGPLRIITNEFGSDAYGFDVVMPVRKQGTGPADEAGNAGFRILAGYIFGGNQGARQLAMTAPVTQAADASGMRVQFVLPRGVTLETAPEPLDPRVQLREVPASQWAALRYSGTWSQANYDEHLALLKTTLAKEGVATQGEPVLARYNAPFTPWFLRRNEIWLALR